MYMRAFLAELIFTLFLASVVLNVATTKSQEGNSFFGLAIGFAVTSGAVCVGDVSSAVFNPAVGFALWVVGSIYDTTWNYWSAHCPHRTLLPRTTVTPTCACARARAPASSSTSLPRRLVVPLRRPGSVRSCPARCMGRGLR